MSSRSIVDLEPAVAERARDLVARAHDAGYRVVITQTRRSIDEQNRLFASGRSVPGKVITNARGGYSWHNFGLAFDVAFLTLAHDVVWSGPWEEIGALGRDLGLTWGGDFANFPDRPHFEFPNGLTLTKLRAQIGLIE